jgi:hypothetical protein
MFFSSVIHRLSVLHLVKALCRLRQKRFAGGGKDPLPLAAKMLCRLRQRCFAATGKGALPNCTFPTDPNRILVISG